MVNARQQCLDLVFSATSCVIAPADFLVVLENAYYPARNLYVNFAVSELELLNRF